MTSTALGQLFLRELERALNRPAPKDRIIAQYHLLQQVFFDQTQRERLQFATLFARMSYAFQQSPVPGELQAHTHRFRKTADDLLRHGGSGSDELSDRAAHILLKLLQHFYQVGIPPSLEKWTTIELPALGSRREGHTYLPHARVLVIGASTESQQLLARPEDAPEQVVRIQYGIAERNENFQQSIDLLRHSFGFPLPVQLLEIDISPEGIYAPRGWVLNPDYLTDVSAISECFQPGGPQPYLYLLKKFLPYSTSKYLLLGNIANFFLDELMSDPDTTFKKTFSKVFQISPLGFSLLPDAVVREIQQKSQRHFLSLKKVLHQDFPKRKIQVENSFLEPTFYSGLYGLQGRLDVYHQSGQEAHIVELKSGKPFRPNIHGISVNHFTQTLLYDLLIRSMSNRRLQPENYILYSTLDQDQLKYAPPVKAQQMEALEVRNQLVAFEQYLAGMQAADATPIDQSHGAQLLQRLRPERQPTLSGYNRDNLERFYQAIHQLSAEERSYFLAFTGFIAREHLYAKTGVSGSDKLQGQAGLWLRSPEEKEQSFEILQHLELIDNQAATSNPVLRFRRTDQTNPLANFRVGDIGILYPHPRAGETPLSNQLFKGSILEVSGDHILFRLRYPQFNDRLFEERPVWCIEHDFLDSSFNGMYRGLFAWAESPSGKRSLLLTKTAPRRPEQMPDEFPFPKLTDEQQRILAKALSAPDYFLLWGPPGTGKTSFMLRYLVEHLLNHTQERVLLLAYTNRAVDEICDAIEQIHGDMRDAYLRIGSSSSTPERYREQLMEEKISRLEKRKEIRELLASHRIYVGTLSSFLNKQELLELLDFDRVIIDEASQILEPMLVGLLPRFKQFILIGDHQQLPAVVLQDERESAVEIPALQGLGLHNMRNSLFERLYRKALEQNWDWAYDQLSIQGRMHRDIMAFPNEFFYHKILQTLPAHLVPDTPQEQPLSYQLPENADTLQKQLSQHRLLFFPTPVDRDSQNGKTNQPEAVWVSKIIQAFQAIYAANDLPWTSNTLGIITPYRAQIAQIQDHLQQAGMELNSLTIDTVERYQGGARDIIVISLCTNQSRQLDALISHSDEGVDRKLNVALTRARKHLILLGNPAILGSDLTYRALLEYCGISDDSNESGNV
jgi:DNA replication ATP-dependent helicase Dna2